MPTTEVAMSGPAESRSQLLAADTDRAVVAEILGSALRAGRLTVAEYDERLAAAYTARTHGELAGLTTDLPAPAPERSRAAQPADGGCGAAGGGDLRNAWRGWITTALIVWTIYLATSIGTGFHYPWPVWVVGPWGAVLLARTLTTRGALAHR